MKEKSDYTGFNREDSTSEKKHEPYKQFVKDKRERASSPGGKTPEYERKKYVPGEERRSGDVRRSFNPNFTKDNRPAWGKPGEGSDRPAGGRHDYEGRPSGERREYGSKEGNRYAQGDGKPYGGQKYEKRKEYGGTGEKRAYGNKPPHESGKVYGSRQGEGSYRREGPGVPGKGVNSYRRNGDNRNRQDRPRYDSTNYPTFSAPPIENEIRLNRYVAMSGICSRREADEFIKSGAITVNGEIVTELGSKVSAKDEIRFNGNVLVNEKKVYIVMNKPKGYVTSMEDPHADKTVIDLLKNGCRERVYPVGRLDKNSMGVLLITNDGDLAKKLTHPSYEKRKIYQASLDKPLTKADMDALAQGVELEDGEVHADAISYVGDKKSEIGIEIHSGRNRIVRRMFEHLGYRVHKLDRVYFAGLTKQKLKRGSWRFLTPREVQILLSGRYE